VLLIAVASIRFVSLDADPGLVKSVMDHAGDVGDEGYWSFGARNLVLFGRAVTDDHFPPAMSPLYTPVVAAFYWLFGVSTLTTRLPNALLGVAAVVLAYQLFLAHDRRAAAVAGLTVALENNFFTYTRIGHTEVMVGVFVLLAFVLLIRAKSPLAAGVAFGLALSSKVTAVLLGPAFGAFLLLQWMRRELSVAQALRLGVGVAVGLIPIAAFVLMNPELFFSAFTVGSQGVSLFRDPARTLINFVTGHYTSYPSIVLLLVLVGAYCSRIRIVSLAGPKFRARLSALTAIDVMVLCWLGGYAVAMIGLSDMVHRRMNLFTIPLAMIPALLLLRREAAAATPATTRLQAWVLFMPVLMVGSLVLRRVLQALTGYDTGTSLLIAAGAMTLATALLVAVWRRMSPVWQERSGWLSLLAWIGIASMSLTYSLQARVLPKLELTGAATQALIAAACLGLICAFGVLAVRRAAAGVAVLLLLNVVLDGADLATASFTQRDSSREMRSFTTAEDYVVGDSAHALSLDASFRPLQVYPSIGVNSAFVARVRPTFLLLKQSRRDGLVDGPSYGDDFFDQHDLFAIGASRVDAVKTFGLYPYPGGPPELITTVYKVTY
jgi:4-amino-4-deoxy-L-arabinose transferase-like glycosyltransferase